MGVGTKINTCVAAFMLEWSSAWMETGPNLWLTGFPSS